jgi:hypothetical protein
MVGVLKNCCLCDEMDGRQAEEEAGNIGRYMGV